MTFRTSQSDALLFFAASPGAQEEYHRDSNERRETLVSI
jgi:hypothetical protein